MIQRPDRYKLSSIVWFGAGYKLRTVSVGGGVYHTREQFFDLEKYGTKEKALEAASRAEERFLSVKT